MKNHLAIVLGISLVSGAAMAGNEGDVKQTEATESTPYHAMAFEDLDVNQDSLISAQEATDSQVLDSEAFASADSNQDGYLSRTEFDASVGIDTGTESDLEVVDPAADVEELEDER